MGIAIPRRLFLLSWLFQARTTQLQVEVIEVFVPPDGPCALLVHHASEETRDDFSRWIRANTGSRINCRLANDSRIDCRIFRVSMCFGRGLIVSRTPVVVKPKDILTINSIN